MKERARIQSHINETIRDKKYIGTNRDSSETTYKCEKLVNEKHINGALVYYHLENMEKCNFKSLKSNWKEATIFN